MKTLLAWLLWLWISLVIVGAFFYAPIAEHFRVPGSSRIVFFHVPMSWASFVGFISAAVCSFRYLFGRFERWRAWVAIGILVVGVIFAKVYLTSPVLILRYGAGVLALVAFSIVIFWNFRYRRQSRDLSNDRSAAVAVQLGLLFGVLATVTGAMWARIEWGAWWNWDPRQTSMLVSLLFYGAYLALRQSINEPDLRARLAAAYALLGLVVTPFLFWIVPRITFSLHPDPVVNSAGKVEMATRIQHVLYASGLGHVALFFWMHNLQGRLQAVDERKSNSGE